MATYYVKVGGNDSSNGTSDGTAWATISKVNNSSFSAGDNILFNRGDIFYGTLIMSQSGTSGSKITVGAYGTGAKPVITGFTTISGWTNYGNGIYSKAISVTDLNMVTMDGVVMGMGRYPKEGTWRTNTGVGSGYIDDSSLPASPNWTGAKILMKTAAWKIDHGTITSQSSGRINYTRQTDWAGPDGISGWGYFIYDDIRTLSTISGQAPTLGEWYHNGSTLYMYFGAVDPTTKVVKVASLEEGLIAMSKEYITIDNISFLGFNGQGWENTWVAGTLNLLGSNHLTITNCEIGFSGLSSIMMGENVTIDNCYIHDGNAHALNPVGDGYVDDNLLLTNTIIENIGQHFSLLGGWTARGMATNFLGSNNMTFRYNSFKHIGNSAVYTGGSNITVDQSYFEDCVNRTFDGGAVYMPGYGTNRVVTDNIINGVYGNWEGAGSANHPTNIWDTAEGIYLDEPTGDPSGSNSVTITGNTISGVLAGSAIKLHRQHSVTIANNTIFNCYQAYQVINWETVTYSYIHNIDLDNNIMIALAADQVFWVYHTSSNANNNDNVNQFATLNNQVYNRPINDDVFSPYNIGRDFDVIDRAHGDAWRTWANWLSITGKESGSVFREGFTSNRTTDIHFQYNASQSAVDYDIAGTIIDVLGNAVSGTITLQPYTSIVLYGTGSVTEVGGTPAIPVTAVTVTGAGGAITITTDNGTLQMSAHIDPHDATDQTVVWSVQNGTGSASISSTGLLTAITNGTVTVKAISNG